MFPLKREFSLSRCAVSLFLPVCIVLLLLYPALADEPLTPPGEGSPTLDLFIPAEPALTDHEAVIGGRIITFQAEAGHMPLFDPQSQERTGQIFYVAYTGTEADDLSKRPLTFVFNGGPGSPSIWLHMGAFGPFRAPVVDDGLRLPRPPYGVKANPYSLLDETDLVFIDPVGTGFSRPAPDEEGEEPEGQSFWGVMEDVDAVAEFIRMYLTRADRWASPIYLAGESYGGMRAAGLSATLQDLGIEPSGLILIAPAISYGELISDRTNDRSFVHLVPTLAACAHYHGRLSAELQAMEVTDVMDQARRWCLETYLPALWQGNRLPDEDRASMERELAAWTGLPQERIRKYRGRIPEWLFAEEILGPDRLFLSLYDGRMTAPGGEYRYSQDPLMTHISTPFATSFNDYLLNTLGYDTDQPYSLSGDDAHRNWNWTSGTEGRPYGYPNTAIDLETALRRNPYMKVFTATGDYDMVCPVDSVVYTLQHLDIPRNRQDNITFRSYPAGHMMYVRESVLRQMKEDLKEFYTAQPLE